MSDLIQQEIKEMFEDWMKDEKFKNTVLADERFASLFYLKQRAVKKDISENESTTAV